MGVQLGAGPYFDAVYAAAHLAAKKVIVCDLDNTLWDGVIGEGKVTHYADRQEVLKELRRRGVLLSINSKNDPRNVHWTGARLRPADFVAPQINWDPKATNVGRIRDELNLKVKDFVYLDDRADELERVQAAFPEIHVLDAAQPRTWRCLSPLADRMLPADADEDRTRLYHERMRRDEFVRSLSSADGGAEDEVAALADLGLAATIRKAVRSDLKRAAELINRTNQFNLCGSRTTPRELQDGDRHGCAVLIADARDKFGRMGVVGVMVVEVNPDRVDVPIFVLSCRAFGFGIEFALLNAIRCMAPPGSRLVGHYKETQSNQPCRRMYPRAGLSWDGQHWVGLVSGLPPDPAWLSIENHLVASSAASAPLGPVMGLFFCVTAFGLSLLLGRRSLTAGLAAVFTVGYLYGILRATTWTRSPTSSSTPPCWASTCRRSAGGPSSAGGEAGASCGRWVMVLSGWAGVHVPAAAATPADPAGRPARQRLPGAVPSVGGAAAAGRTLAAGPAGWPC